MIPAKLLAHFERAVEAPGSVPEIRALIIDLAVTGRLVRQEDKGYSEKNRNLEVQEGIARLASACRRCRWTASDPIIKGATPFRLPPSWTWARLNDTGLYINGIAFKPADWKSAGLPIIRIQNLSDDTKEFNYTEGEFPEENMVRVGDLVVSWSATLDAFIWRRREGVLNQHIFKAIVNENAVARDYLYWLLKHEIRVLAESDHAHGLAMKHINRGPFLAHVVALPPRAEQHRIVAKVNELMALCDRLEAAQAERENRRDRVVAASLHRLNNGADREAFREHARFHLRHLPRLTTRPEHIQQLRQTILNLAVRGQLASEAGWPEQAEALGTFATLQNGYAFKSEWFARTGVRLLRNANVSHGVMRWDELACLPEDRSIEFERFQLNEGDVVLSLDRPFIVTGTKVARVRPQDLPCLLLQRVGRFQPKAERLCADYLFLWLHSPHFTDQIDPGRSNGVPHISSNQVEAAEIFVPPLAEQHRIVTKVDELMALCDRLEAQLTTARTDSRHLLETIVDVALRSGNHGAHESAVA